MFRINLAATITLISLVYNSVFAQIPQGGEPYKWNNKQDVPSTIITLPNVHIEALLAEDAVTEKHKDIPYRFAYAHNVNYTLSNSGTWTNTKNGKIWQLRVKSPDAYSLNVTFNKFKLTEGAKLFIYNANKTYFIGGFTSKNNKANEELGTTPIPGDDIIIELFEPNNPTTNSEIEIRTIAHDYKGIFNKAFKNFGGSGNCNINTSCSQGNGWENQIKSVALITLGDGTRICSGSLVNNTSQDKTPYFLTANHCLDASLGTWVFIFGYESSVCTPSQDGILTNSISGATLRANSSNSDFGLLELSTIPPPSYNTYYSGWDNSETKPSNQTGIHHPSGDVKKISIDSDSASLSAVYSGADWEIGSWDQGTTEGGSSGSPLFDQNKRIIGQLEGGGAACGNTQSDYYGRFGVSWNGASAATRLKDWLDPSNSGVSTLDGLNPNLSQLANDLSVSPLNSINNSFCGNSMNLSFDVYNIGTTTVNSFTYTVKLNSNVVGTSTWYGNLSTGQNTSVNFGSVNLSAGSDTIEVEIINPNGSSDPNTADNSTTKTFNVFNPFSFVDVKITLDNYGSETTWAIKNQAGATLYAGGPYSDFSNGTLINKIVCLGNGCYDFIIYDAANDGICCGYGNGSYTLDIFSTTLASSNGQFTSQQTKPFCITTAGIEKLPENDIEIFPNPTSNYITVKSKTNNLLSNIKLFDVVGQELLNFSNINSSDLTVDLSNFTKGNYILSITNSKNEIVTKKISVIK